MSARAATAAALIAAMACHRAVVVGSPTSSVLQGVVSVTGTSFEQRLELQTAGQSTRLVAGAADSAALVRLGGAEVSVRGTLENRAFLVAAFTALSVSGAPVVDGVVRVDGQSVALETATGRVMLGNPPAALRQLAGARVWVSGPIDKGPNSYGVIVPAR